MSFNVQDVKDPLSTLVILGLSQYLGKNVKLSSWSKGHQYTVQSEGYITSAARKWSNIWAFVKETTSSEKTASDSRDVLWKLYPVCIRAGELYASRMENDPLAPTLRTIFKWAIKGIELGLIPTYLKEKSDKGRSAVHILKNTIRPLKKALKGKIYVDPTCEGIEMMRKWLPTMTDEDITIIGNQFQSINSALIKKSNHQRYIDSALEIIGGVTEELIATIKPKDKYIIPEHAAPMPVVRQQVEEQDETF